MPFVLCRYLNRFPASTEWLHRHRSHACDSTRLGRPCSSPPAVLEGPLLAVGRHATQSGHTPPKDNWAIHNPSSVYTEIYTRSHVAPEAGCTPIVQSVEPDAAVEMPEARRAFRASRAQCVLRGRRTGVWARSAEFCLHGREADRWCARLAYCAVRA